MQSGQMRFNMKMCELLAIARDVADSMNESITAKSQQLTLDATGEAFMIYADPDRVAQILTNLVSNANKYTGEGGRIRISLSQNGESAQVSVADNGCGIKPEDQAKLFTQFFRSDDPFVREQVGWGLGLSIVKMMVEAQSGEINFESSYGQGSTFTLTLPLSREKPARKHE
jgi:signal transduction histidine kinase